MANAPYFLSSVTDHKAALALIDEASRNHRVTEALLLNALELSSAELEVALNPLATGGGVGHIDEFLDSAECFREVLQSRLNLVDKAVERISVVTLHLLEGRRAKAAGGGQWV